MLTAGQQYQLLNKATVAKRETQGFNLDSLQSQSIDNLFASYDQVQVKSGAQSILLQRSTANQTVAPRTDINGLGQLQVLPDVGAAQTNYQVAQRQAAATAATQAAAATPAWEKLAVPIGIGAAALIAIVLAIRHG